VSREVETDLADIFGVRQLPDELADFERAGACRSQRMKTQGDPHSPLSAETDGLEPIPAGQFCRDYYHRLRSLVQGLDRIGV
jgi:hypothetical protein